MNRPILGGGVLISVWSGGDTEKLVAGILPIAGINRSLTSLGLG